MRNVRWHPRPPPAWLQRRLARDGYMVVSGRAPAEVEIVETLEKRQLPEPPGSGLPWIWLSPAAIGSVSAREAAVRGAYDAISMGDEQGVEKLCTRLAELFTEHAPPPDAPTFVAESDAAKHALQRIAQVATTSMPVLITGETGSGKEVVARLLHQWSRRREKRFVPINCAAIPNELMEAELFGYSKGAFSGAVQKFDGQLMAAEGGTVFLDEIDDTPLSTQVKLLRVLEDRVVQRLGESEPHRVDFRIIAATNRDLKPLIASGAFGADFYERLAIVTIQLPPLRDRLADIPALAQHFMQRFHKEEPLAHGRVKVTGIAAAAVAALQAYPWPGNIRELRNVLFEALVYKKAGDELLLSDLPRRVLRRHADIPHGAAAQPVVNEAAVYGRMDAGGFDLRTEVENLERIALQAALHKSDWNASEAARLLGSVGRGEANDPGGTVRAMMKRLGVKKPLRRARG